MTDPLFDEQVRQALESAYELISWAKAVRPLTHWELGVFDALDDWITHDIYEDIFPPRKEPIP